MNNAKYQWITPENLKGTGLEDFVDFEKTGPNTDTVEGRCLCHIWTYMMGENPSDPEDGPSGADVYQYVAEALAYFGLQIP